MTARGPEKTRAWIEVTARPGGWTIRVYVLRPGRRVAVADRWLARTVRGVRRALEDAASLRRRLAS